MSFFTWTGNPFVDNGIGAMLAHSEKKTPEELNADDVQAVGEKMLRVYLTPGWLKSMQNIFPNGAFTNGAFASRREDVARRLTEFLVFKVAPPQFSGSCVYCGQREGLRLTPEERKQLPVDIVLSKTYVPLNGGVLNFFPGGVKGADICANCVFAIQCAPLNFYTANFDEKRFVALHSNSDKVLRAWSNRARKSVESQIALGKFDGCFNEGFNKVNAFFRIVEEIMNGYDWDDRDRYTTIRFYHFDNYNQPKAQPLKIYDLPAPTFRFLALALQNQFRAEWKGLVRRNYYFTKGGVEITLPPVGGNDDEERYKTQRNHILESLLAGRPITRFFFFRRDQKAYVSWEFLSLYLKDVLSMPDERIATIKRVGDEMALVIKANKKRLGQLENARNYASFRNVLLRFIKDRKEIGAPAPLFTLDEYDEHLFPQGALGWKETQDLLLFRIYETLHDWLRPEDVPQTGDDADENADGTEMKDDQSTLEAINA
jgi:CRISPR-associated protein Cst1